MNKLEVQGRVLQNGCPLDLDKFAWDEATNTFSSPERHLMLGFSYINGCTFKVGSYCTFKVGSYCTFDTGYECTFDAGDGCAFDTDSGCTFDTGSDCTFDTGSDCTFNTGSDCTFNTSYDCTFNTSYDCTFNADSSCTFDTGDGCTFDTGYGCTFKTGEYCVIVNRSTFEIITPRMGDKVQICPLGIPGYLVNGMYNGKPHIIADKILSEVINKKGSVYHVVNHGEYEKTYLIEKNGAYSHGKTFKEAKEGLVYKLSDRDTSKYRSMTLDDIVTRKTAIEMYMTITGSCSGGTKYFVDSLGDEVKSRYSVRELISLTQGQYGNAEFERFFKVT